MVSVRRSGAHENGKDAVAERQHPADRICARRPQSALAPRRASGTLGVPTPDLEVEEVAAARPAFPISEPGETAGGDMGHEVVPLVAGNGQERSIGCRAARRAIDTDEAIVPVGTDSIVRTDDFTRHVEQDLDGRRIGRTRDRTASRTHWSQEGE